MFYKAKQRNKIFFHGTTVCFVTEFLVKFYIYCDPATQQSAQTTSSLVKAQSEKEGEQVRWHICHSADYSERFRSSRLLTRNSCRPFPYSTPVSSIDRRVRERSVAGDVIHTSDWQTDRECRESRLTE